MNTRLSVVLVSVLAALRVFATPSIVIESFAKQPGDTTLVDLTYTIADLDSGTSWADYTLDFTLDALDAGESFGLRLTNFVEGVDCDLPTTEGTHTITWDSSADGLPSSAVFVKLTGSLVYDPVPEADADLMIIDISGGAEALSYPTRLVRGYLDRLTEFNRDLYKDDRIIMRKCRHGEFWSGAAADVGLDTVAIGLNCNYNSENRHRVRLTKDFYLGLFETTQAQYIKVTGASNPSGFKGNGALAPLENLSWVNFNAAGGFLARLNARVSVNGASVVIQLPTEAQGEYAARAGETTRFFWGATTWVSSGVNYSWSKLNSDTGGSTHPVGGKLPNAWGFYDILGNVSEFTRDCDTDKAYQAYHNLTTAGTLESPNVDPENTSTRYKVYLGGSFNSGWTALCIGPRTSLYDTNYQKNELGFRISREVAGAMPGVPTTEVKATDEYEMLDPSSGSSVDMFTVAVIPATPYTGFAVTPTPEIRNGDDELLELGVDYALSYVSNVETGTAMVVITGLGVYSGSRAEAFEIVEPVDEVVAVDTAGAVTARVDLGAGPKVARTSKLLPPIAMNSAELFPTNGISLWPLSGAANAVARVSAAPMESAEGEPGAYQVIGETASDGAVVKWRANPGWWMLKLEVLTNGVPREASFFCPVRIKSSGGVSVTIR